MRNGLMDVIRGGRIFHAAVGEGWSPLMTASLSDRFMRRLPETARRAVDCFAAEVPYYGMLPREVLDGEITEFTKQHFRIFARVMLESRAPTDDEFAVSILAASRRAQEDIPLPAVLAVYNVAARVGIETLRELATPDEVDEVLAVSVQLQRYLQLMLPAVTAAYLEERQGVYGAAADARRDLFEALVKGMPWEEAAERASVTLALSYHVLFLYMPEPATNTVVARRRAHRVQDIVDEYAREPVLAALDGRGGTILLPAVGKVESLLPLFSEVAGVRSRSGCPRRPIPRRSPPLPMRRANWPCSHCDSAGRRERIDSPIYCWSTRSPGRAGHATCWPRPFSHSPRTHTCSRRSAPTCSTSTAGSWPPNHCMCIPTPSTTGCAGLPS